MEVAYQRGPRGLRKGDDRRLPVAGRGDPALEEGTQAGQAGGEDHGPQQFVVVVEKGHAGLGGPERREEGHTIPDLDQGVATTVDAEKLSGNRPWKDEVATGPADHPVAGPSGRGAVAGRM